MSYVKNYDVGQIKLDTLNSSKLADAPYMQYTHELPLLSFGDIQNTVGLSLVFNYKRYRDEKSTNSSEFLIAPGFKLNLQKCLICTSNGVPTSYQGEDGKIIQLNSFGNKFTFKDESQRILRSTGQSHVVEYPDFSKEIYDTSGKITAVYDKYTNIFLSYTYNSDDQLTSIEFRDGKTVNFDYDDSSNRLSTITFNNQSIHFNYNSGMLSYVEHYTGVKYYYTLRKPDNVHYFQELPESNLKVEATSIEVHDDEIYTVSYSKELSLREDGNNTVIDVIDRIGTNVINTITYKPARNLLDDWPSEYYDIVDNNGVVTRVQICDGQLTYSYEVQGDNPKFEKDLPQNSTTDRFLGNVNIYNAVWASENQKERGVQTIKDGNPMSYYTKNDYQYWNFGIADNNEKRGYYTVSGWIKSDDINESQKTFFIGPTENFSNEFEVHFVPNGQWQYFSITSFIEAHSIYVRTVISNSVSVRDVRVTFNGTGIPSGNDTSHTILSDCILLKGSEAISFNDVRFYTQETGGSQINDEENIVTFSDALRFILRKIKYGITDEVYYNNCKDIFTNASGLWVAENDSDTRTNIINYDLGIRSYSGKEESLTRYHIYTVGNTSYNLQIMYVTKGTRVSSKTLNMNLDLIQSEEDGITTQYTRDAFGRVTEETVPGLYKYVTTYTDSLITVNDVNISTTTGETMNSVKYHIDTAWGVINKVELLSSSGAAQSLTINTYDDAKNTVISKAFDNMYISKNTFEYKHGRLASIGNGAIDYDFAYNDTVGKLESISKNGASIEHHAYKKNNGELTVESSYASSKNALHTESITFDQYGRLKCIDNILENVYKTDPYWYYCYDNNQYTTMENYNRSQHGELTQSTIDSNGRDALLAQTTDKLTSEVIRYGYDNGKITAAVTKDLFDILLRQETFAYDNAGRLTKDRFDYDLAGNGYVTSEIKYERTDTDALANHQVETYTYKVGSVIAAETENDYDGLHRVMMKNYLVGNETFFIAFDYNGKQITSTTELIDDTTNYEYDDIGRIISISNVYNGTNITYKYNNSGRLIRENNKALDKTFVYQYNNGGISKIKEYAYTTGSVSGATAVTTSFAYDSTFPDRLKSCGSTSISYNSIGCPTAYNGYTATWTRGKLSKLSKGNTLIGINAYNYSYNAFGQRVRCNYTITSGTTSGSVAIGTPMGYDKIFRYDQSGRLIYENKTSQYYGEIGTSEKIVYLYDENSIIGMVYTNASGVSNTYYFQRNLLGDVIGIYNASGNRVGGYVYDAWGNCTITLNTGNIATINPIRYRGYYYDEESGLYYLNARYYSPTWCRFISPDDTAYLDPDSFNGLNQYCYCNNDPVNYVDPSGHSVVGAILSGAAIGLGISIVSSIFIQLEEHAGNWAEVNPLKVLYDGVFGAINGALAASGIGIGWSILLGATLGFVSSVGNDYIFKNGEINWLGAINAAFIGGIAGAIAGAGANYAKDGMQVTKYINSKSILQKTIANGTKRAIARQTHALHIHATPLIISGVRYIASNIFSNSYTIITN